MDKANVSIIKYFSKQTLSGISHIAAKKLILSKSLYRSRLQQGLSSAEDLATQYIKEHPTMTT
jgi:hypothetical protein